jgi:hypothetical protein
MTAVINGLAAAALRWFTAWRNAWENFWFVPSSPHTLALIRILGGAMLLYTHLVWTINLNAFLGSHPWVNAPTSRLWNQGVDGSVYAFSHLWISDAPLYVWTMHFLALAVFAALTVGLWTRATSILAFLFTLSYCHRLIGSLFGLDQVNAMLATYLMLGRCGDVWSIDAWLRERKTPGKSAAIALPHVSNTIAIRLLQLHLSVLYLFGGITKMRGNLWWDGSALWFAFASSEYQSLDMTWMVRWPALIAFLTHLTLFWETYYAVLVWPKLTRPVVLGMAVAVHGGIALALGMKTFGLAMIIANMAFLTPHESERILAVALGWLRRR